MNVLKPIGLAPELVKQTMRVGGITAVRWQIKSHQRAVSKLLHADITGHKLPYYTDFMEACNAIDAMTDQDLWDAIKAKETKAEKPLQSYRSYFGEFVEVSKKRHTVTPSAPGLRLISLATTNKTSPNSPENKPDFYSISPTTEGIAFCKDGENEWRHEQDLFLFGSLPRFADKELAKVIYPDSSQRGHYIPITGKTSESNLIPRLPFANTTIELVEKNYIKCLDVGNILLVVDSYGQIYHFGYIMAHPEKPKNS